MSPFQREPLIDIVKVLAAQFIFLHHAAFYGPLSDAWFALEPAWVNWFARYGRLAVQIFLVIAGYLAVQTLSRGSALHPLLFISKRFERLARPLWFALGVTVVLTALARPWLTDGMLPEAPRADQVLAHVFLLQSTLGYEALSAGVWYTAVDFQLYVVMVWLVLASRRFRFAWVWPLLVTCLVLLSAFWLNRHEEWDASGFYFFAAYGLGALVCWARQQAPWGRWLFGVGGLLVLVSLWIEWRLRLAVALGTAVFLWRALGWELSGQGWVRLFERLNGSTYLFFLLNFPWLILANLIWVVWTDVQQVGVVPYVLVTWLSGVWVADGLQHRLTWLSATSFRKVNQ